MKLRKIGIYSIGEGKLDTPQTRIMFGEHGYEHPNELKFCFISGCVFLDKFSSHILHAMKYGCSVKILLANEEVSKDFLNRTEVLCPQYNDKGEVWHYIDQITFSKKVIENIRKIAKDNNYPGTIELRQYIDEYRYAFRLGNYGQRENFTMRLWANFQPLCLDAINLSLGVHGILESKSLDTEEGKDKEASSIVSCIDSAFNQLWNQYESTKY